MILIVLLLALSLFLLSLLAGDLRSDGYGHRPLPRRPGDPVGTPRS